MLLTQSLQTDLTKVYAAIENEKDFKKGKTHLSFMESTIAKLRDNDMGLFDNEVTQEAIKGIEHCILRLREYFDQEYPFTLVDAEVWCWYMGNKVNEIEEIVI